MKYNVAIIGCGAIFKNHLSAINENSHQFNLAAICDIKKDIVDMHIKDLNNVDGYTDYRSCVKRKDINFVVIATPNSLHFDQAIEALKNNCDVLIEKPSTFTTREIETIISVAKKHEQKAYCVLQVRLNETVNLIRNVMSNGDLGIIRGFSLVQRWQRPKSYFTGWRNIPQVGGGTLYEVGIHYLDILQQLLGMPKSVVSTRLYNTKHHEANVEDTVYSILDYENFGGTIEITVSAEPRNIECSIQLIGSNGYLKLGGKALNEISEFEFLDEKTQKKFKKDLLASKSKIEENNNFNKYGTHLGSCPNHAGVYRNLDSFAIEETINVIQLIESIYNKAGISYTSEI